MAALPSGRIQSISSGIHKAGWLPACFANLALGACSLKVARPYSAMGLYRPFRHRPPSRFWCECVLNQAFEKASLLTGEKFMPQRITLVRADVRQHMMAINLLKSGEL